MEEQSMETNEQEQQEKAFTQDEVNRIVQERLARVKASQRKPEEAESNSELDDREASVARRESRVECHEFVVEKGYKKELLDILDTSNAETFRSQAERLAELYAAPEEKKSYPGTKPNPSFIQSDQRGSSFAKTKHIPKQY